MIIYKSMKIFILFFHGEGLEVLGYSAKNPKVFRSTGFKEKGRYSPRRESLGGRRILLTTNGSLALFNSKSLYV